MCSDTDMGVGAGCAAATPGGITISNARGLEPLQKRTDKETKVQVWAMEQSQKVMPPQQRAWTDVRKQARACAPIRSGCTGQSGSHLDRGRW
jgi:hypothetical protein